MEKVRVGIESINYYAGSAYVDVSKIVKNRDLDSKRFENLLMIEKTVPLNFEDPVSLGVNAAKPIIDALTAEERDSIQMLITCTESGIDFGKSISTYVHQYLGLSRNCRLFELKNACFSGTAGFQNALNHVVSQVSPESKVLVVATDLVKFTAVEGSDTLSADWSFGELSGGAGAVAILVSEKPYIYEADFGANGSYGYEIMDTCRPEANMEAGNADLSLMSYLDCVAEAYKEYSKKVSDVNFLTTFDYLIYHTPFGGMVKGAHRTMLRKLYKVKPQEIELDFEKRVKPGLEYCMRIGNSCGATIFLALISAIENGNFEDPKRIGVFSYGSGCCSEFYSGVVTKAGQEHLSEMGIKNMIGSRYELSMKEYEKVIENGGTVDFGTRNIEIDFEFMPTAYKGIVGKNKLVLARIKDYHREYIWS